ncbi:hypothetical protein SFUMM280S_07282 [Streptomyces fumanus]
MAQLHGLWLAWADLTGPGSVMTGPASWHRDDSLPVMNSLRDPQGPFAGCKPGMHRAKEKPPIDIYRSVRPAASFVSQVTAQTEPLTRRSGCRDQRRAALFVVGAAAPPRWAEEAGPAWGTPVAAP